MRFLITERLALAGESVPWNHRLEIEHLEVSYEENGIIWIKTLEIIAYSKLWLA